MLFLHTFSTKTSARQLTIVAVLTESLSEPFGLPLANDQQLMVKGRASHVCSPMIDEPLARLTTHGVPTQVMTSDAHGYRPRGGGP